MRIKLINILAGIMIGILISSVAALALNVINIQVEREPLQYYFNDIKKEPTAGEEGFIYNDRTYVPLRFMAETLGKEVTWDGINKRIDIKDRADENTVTSVPIKKIANIDKMRAETSSYSPSSEDDTVLGVYKGYAYVGLSCFDDNVFSKSFYAIYKYNLKDGTYTFVDNSIRGVAGTGEYIGVIGNRLCVGIMRKSSLIDYYSYNLDTMEKLDYTIGQYSMVYNNYIYTFSSPWEKYLCKVTKRHFDSNLVEDEEIIIELKGSFAFILTKDKIIAIPKKETTGEVGNILVNVFELDGSDVTPEKPYNTLNNVAIDTYMSHF